MIERMLKDIYDMVESIEREYQNLLRNPGIRVPSVDMYEENGELVIKAEMPGVRKEDISVEAGKDFIEIRANMGKEEEKKEKNYYKKERLIAQYHRRIDLPFNIDPKNIKARYENGVLEIRVGKKETERVRIRIE